MHSRKPTRREREKARQKNEILEAARNLFSEKEFHNVSMQELADKAEFAVGTLYNFFKNKEALYGALITDMTEQYHATILQALEGEDDTEEKLRRFVVAKGDHFRENKELVRLFLSVTRQSKYIGLVKLAAEVRQRQIQFLDTLAAVFDKGVREGCFAAIATSRHLAIALDSLINTLLLLWIESPEENPYPEDPDVILNIFFKGLMAP